MAQLYQELAERELIKQFRHDNSWLGAVKAKNNWVSNDVIKIPKQGAAPTVLIDNAIYPIASNPREDGFITLALHKYDTENTVVTLEELRTLPYEKLSDVQQQHRETLEDNTARHGLFTLSVPAHSATTPVLTCTGPINPSTGLRRLITADLINYWEVQTALGVPLDGRTVVLCTAHAADLMFEDSNRNNTWGAQWLKGKVPVEHAGYTLYVAAYAPKYYQDGAGVWTRKPYGAAGGNNASIFFWAGNAVKATGSALRIALEASQNPGYRRHEIGFQLWFICVGIKDEGFGALVSPGV